MIDTPAESVPIPSFPGIRGPASACDLRTYTRQDAAIDDYHRERDPYVRRYAALMLEALTEDPRNTVPTPAYGYTAPHYSAAYEAMHDLSDEVAVDLCNLLAACDRADWRTSSILAKALLSRICQEYAQRHVDADRDSFRWLGHNARREDQ